MSISFHPSVLAGCTSVTDGRTVHVAVTPVAIGQIAVSMPPNNGHNSGDIKDIPTEMLKSPFRTPDFHLTPFQGTRSNIRTNLTKPETRFYAEYSCTGQYRSIFISFHARRITPARKQNSTSNSHSRSSKVTHFGISGKPTRDCVSLIIMRALPLKFPKI